MSEPVVDRALDALATVAAWRMVTRRQIKRWKFSGVSETIVKRWADRMCDAGLLGRMRPSANSAQYLWCTPKGRDHLVDHGYAASDLFPARRPIAAKDLAHSLHIVDVAISLHERCGGTDRLFPAWALQRLSGGSLAAIPDVLALSLGSDAEQPRALAAEVDLGGEGLRVLVAKTLKLASWLHGYSEGSVVGLVLLTNGRRRQVSIQKALRGVEIPVPYAVDLLAHFTAEDEKEREEGYEEVFG